MATTTIVNNGDITISKSAPDANSSTGLTLIQGGASEKRILHTYDLSDLVGATINSAVLRFQVSSLSGTKNTGTISKTTKPWAYSAVTWNKYNGVNNWASAGGDFDANVSVSFSETIIFLTNTDIDIDITNLARDAIENENGLLNYIIRTGSSNIIYVIVNHETNPAIEARLLIDYVRSGSIAISEPDNTTPSISRPQYTEFRITNVTSTHSKTQYQFRDQNNNLLFDIISGDSSIRQNGNIFSMDHLALKCFLKSNTQYSIRTRVYDGVWLVWTGWQEFRTRDKDYKYDRTKSKNLPRPVKTSRGATVRNNVASEIDGKVSSISSTERGATVICR